MCEATRQNAMDAVFAVLTAKSVGPGREESEFGSAVGGFLWFFYWSLVCGWILGGFLLAPPSQGDPFGVRSFGVGTIAVHVRPSDITIVYCY